MAKSPIPTKLSKGGKKLKVRRSGNIGPPTERILTIVENLARDCTPVRYIAARLGYGETTFFEHMKKYPELRQAIETGRAERYQSVINVHTEIMSDKTVNPATRLTAAHYELNNVHRLATDSNTDNSLNITLNIDTAADSKKLTSDTIQVIDVTPIDTPDE